MDMFHELDTLVANLKKKMQNRSKVRKNMLRPGGHAKEMGVNNRKQPVPTVNQLKTGKLQAPSLFAQVFGGKRSELPWARRPNKN